MTEPGIYMRCPDCRELVRPGARICRFCRFNFETGESGSATADGASTQPTAPPTAPPQALPFPPAPPIQLPTDTPPGGSSGGVPNTAKGIGIVVAVVAAVLYFSGTFDSGSSTATETVADPAACPERYVTASLCPEWAIERAVDARRGVGSSDSGATCERRNPATTREFACSLLFGPNDVAEGWLVSCPRDPLEDTAGCAIEQMTVRQRCDLGVLSGVPKAADGLYEAEKRQCLRLGFDYG